MAQTTTQPVAPSSDFSQPLRLMIDCHRRVERFLGIIAQIAREAYGKPLNDIQREGLEKSLRYFRQAAPLHTADEEESLFPRLRALDDPEVKAALAQLDALETDHRTVDPMHAEVDRLGSLWLERGTLSDEDGQHVMALSRALQKAYEGHIETEDTVIFPLAGRLLGQDALHAVGREMAERRDVDPESPISRCTARRLAREAAAGGV